MTEDLIQSRKKICEDIDEKILIDLDIVYNKFDLPKSRICEEAIRYVLKNKIKPIKKIAARDDITLTINLNLWEEFKSYAKMYDYKIVHLLETGLRYTLKKYKNKII